MSKTTNKFSPEVRSRAVRMVLDHEGEHPSRWAVKRHPKFTPSASNFARRNTKDRRGSQKPRRERLAAHRSECRPTNDPTASGQPGSLGDLLGGLGGSGGLGGLGDLLRGTSGGGGILSGGLGGLLDQLSQTGHGETAKSWVQDGPNEHDDRGLSEALGPDVLQDIASRTGLTQEEVLSRLSRDLPKAVDGLTPDGTLPAEEDGDAMTEPQTSVPD